MELHNVLRERNRIMGDLEGGRITSVGAVSELRSLLTRIHAERTNDHDELIDSIELDLMIIGG